MPSHFSTASARRSRASRGTALAGIIVLHVAAIAVGMMIKSPRAVVAPQSQPIEVVMFREPRQAPSPDVQVRPPEVVEPQMIMPVINIELPAAAPAAITVTAVPTPAPAPDSAPRLVADGDTDTPVAITQANWVRMPSPVYPAAAKRAKAQGVVLVRALVDTTGHAHSAIVHSSSGSAALDRAACDSVLAALFRPYLLNGVARSVDVIVPITFALNTRGGPGPQHGRDKGRDDLELDVRGENHHAMRGHPEELGSLGAAALHIRE